jgi:23S rRNA (pseudouridine1915-N3)-methyltransferase
LLLSQSGLVFKVKQLLLSVGRRHDLALAVAIDDFTARLSREIPTDWQFIKPSGADEPTARRLESQAILTALKPEDIVVVLDERGRLDDSRTFAARYNEWLRSGRRVVFIIGGAYGVDELVRGRANHLWSLSPLVLPHQLVRLVLSEQLYRARMISSGHPYHHD